MSGKAKTWLQRPLWFLTPPQSGEHTELGPGDALGDLGEKRSLVVASNRVDPLYKVITLSQRERLRTSIGVILLLLTREGSSRQRVF